MLLSRPPLAPSEPLAGWSWRPAQACHRKAASLRSGTRSPVSGRATIRPGDRAGVGARGVVPGDASRGDVGAGAAGRPASFYSARRGRQRHRGKSRVHRDLGTGARRLPRAGRRRAAGAGRGPYGRSDAVNRRTKIVATLGPATGTPERIAGLIDAGANVIRVNASHGTPDLRAGGVAAVRRAAEAAGAPVAVL